MAWTSYAAIATTFAGVVFAAGAYGSVNEPIKHNVVVTPVEEEVVATSETLPITSEIIKSEEPSTSGYPVNVARSVQIGAFAYEVKRQMNLAEETTPQVLPAPTVAETAPVEPETEVAQGFPFFRAVPMPASKPEVTAPRKPARKATIAAKRSSPRPVYVADSRVGQRLSREVPMMIGAFR